MNRKTSNNEEMLGVLCEAKQFLARPGNDFSWSGWKNAAEALNELDGLLAKLQSGNLPARSEIEFLFLPTGPIQEVSLSSGWGKEFLELAGKLDRSIDKAYGRDPKLAAARRAELKGQIGGLFAGKLRWVCTVLGGVSIGFAFYIYMSGDQTEVYFPVHLEGAATLHWTLIASVAYTVLAVINWISWKKRFRKH